MTVECNFLSSLLFFIYGIECVACLAVCQKVLCCIRMEVQIFSLKFALVIFSAWQPQSIFLWKKNIAKKKVLSECLFKPVFVLYAQVLYRPKHRPGADL